MSTNMTLFSELYNCYFQILKSILTESHGISANELRSQIMMDGFEETPLYLLPKLFSGEWGLFEQKGELYYSRLSDGFYAPLSKLQRSYLKTILLDKRMQLFLEDGQIQELLAIFEDTPALWTPDMFYYYDRFADCDDYDSPTYRVNFRTLLLAMENRQFVDIEYLSKTGRRVHHYYYPARLEFSIKNNKFRLLSVKHTKQHQFRLETLNLDRVECVSLIEETMPESFDVNALIKESYYREPVRLLIRNERNALERTMLHFANYEKNTTKREDNLYECLIYYNKMMETELLIEVMSFGPMIQVLGNEGFLAQLKERLKRQQRLASKPITTRCHSK